MYLPMDQKKGIRTSFTRLACGFSSRSMTSMAQDLLLLGCGCWLRPYPFARDEVWSFMQRWKMRCLLIALLLVLVPQSLPADELLTNTSSDDAVVGRIAARSKDRRL